MTDFEKFFNNNDLSITIWNNKYRYNNESFEEWLNRVSNNNPYIRQLIKNKRFIFGGRTLANRNIKDGSYSNCYSIGYVPDTLQDIMDVNTKLALTYKAQGGQGLSLSKIRPKGTNIKDYYQSDGIIPFMRLFNQTTSCISQGGSRKGALLMAIDIWHKEAEDFIKIKSEDNEITKANLSVEIDDAFMQDICQGYKTGKSIIRHIKRNYDGHIVEYDVDTMKLWKLLCTYAHDHAEPGIIFTNKFRNYNIMQHDKKYKIEICNPCGEQPLPKHGACNLGSINISTYVKDSFTSNASFDFNQLKKDIPYIVEAMDEVLEENSKRHALKEQRQMSLDYRNIGIGIMGLADTFVRLRMTYGDEDSIRFTEKLIKFLFRECVFASVNLAKVKGSFPGYTPVVWDSDIIAEAFTAEEIQTLKETNCLRNCSLLSIAPTGSIGTMLNISTGIEPFFQLSYIRKTESLNNEETYYKVDVQAVSDFKNITGIDEIPSFFTVSSDIYWKDRIAIQGVLQKFVDTAISSTLNLPKRTTVEEVENIYMESWKQGLKGVTIYIEGSRSPILSKSDTNFIKQRQAPKRPTELEADFYQITSRGELFIVLVGLFNNKPYEIFTFRPIESTTIPPHKGKIIKKGKMKYQYDSPFIRIDNIELANSSIEEKAATLYSSMLLRHGVDIEYIIKTAKKVNDNITSFSSAMCRILSKYITSKEVKTEKCPECGASLIRTEGCIQCTNCGWSRCM